MKTAANIKERLNLDFQQISNTSNSKRWNNIKRLYSVEDVRKLRGTVKIEYSLARQGAEKLWKYLIEDDFFKIPMESDL